MSTHSYRWWQFTQGLQFPVDGPLIVGNLGFFREKDNYSSWVFDSADLKKAGIDYVLFQVEKGDKDGYIHMQGMAHTTKKMGAGLKKKGTGFKHVFGSATVHIEPALDPEALKVYCSKEETRLAGPFEYGKWVAQGKRSDLDELVDDCKAGMSKKEIVEKHTALYIRYHGGVDKTVSIYDVAQKRKDPYLVWLVGDSGTGKSWWSNENYPDAHPYNNANPKFYEKYAGQWAGIFDDWQPEDFDTDLPTWLTRISNVATNVPLKGMEAVPYKMTHFIFSSSTHQPWEIGKGKRQYWDIQRRILQYTGAVMQFESFRDGSDEIYDTNPTPVDIFTYYDQHSHDPSMQAMMDLMREPAKAKVFKRLHDKYKEECKAKAAEEWAAEALADARVNEWGDDTLAMPDDWDTQPYDNEPDVQHQLYPRMTRETINLDDYVLQRSDRDTIVID